MLSASGWLIVAVRQRDPLLASQVFARYLQHVRRHDYRQEQGAPWEGFGPKGNAQNGVYMASVTLPWAALSAGLMQQAEPVLESPFRTVD